MTQYVSIAKRPRTYFVDIDGVIFKQDGRWPDIDLIEPKKDLLPGIRKKFLEWESCGCRIILTTGRADNYRKITEEQLRAAGIPYHHLIMGAGMGQRVLINNLKTQEPDVPTAIAVNIKMDQGFTEKDTF